MRWAGSTGTPTPDSTSRPASTPEPTPAPSLPPGAVVLDATGRQYSATVIEGVANVPTIVYFTNNDELNHNLTIYRNASKDLELFRRRDLLRARCHGRLRDPAPPCRGVLLRGRRLPLDARTVHRSLSSGYHPAPCRTPSATEPP